MRGKYGLGSRLSAMRPSWERSENASFSKLGRIAHQKMIKPFSQPAFLGSVQEGLSSFRKKVPPAYIIAVIYLNSGAST